MCTSLGSGEKIKPDLVMQVAPYGHSVPSLVDSFSSQSKFRLFNILPMRGLQLVRPGYLAQKSNIITSAARSASCSRGWLRLMVQSIFAAITVASFILILLMSIPKWPPPKPDEESRCTANACRVVCQGAPYFGEYEEDIIQGITEVDASCKSIFLTLNKPMFNDNRMPPQWLDILRSNIHELTIMNGNLQHVPCDAFMSQYSASIRVLEFENLDLRSWTSNSLVGLSSLQKLYIRNSTIRNVPRDALRSVDDTLQSLTITRSNFWDPTNITGSTSFERLTIVDFSSNYFSDVLGRNSFTGLQSCKNLYLNSCGIIAIGEGAFDNLHSIESIFLHNNFLITIPAGLFSNIMAITYPRPRINLQDNLWHCDCLAYDIRQLTSNGLLLMNPHCDSPEDFKDKTFEELEFDCSQKEKKYLDFKTNTTDKDRPKYDLWDELKELNDDNICSIVYLSNDCRHGYTVMNSSLRMFSPVYGHMCPETEVTRSFFQSDKRTVNERMPNKDWIKLTYFLKTNNYSMVEIGALEPNEYGLLWYQTNCPNEVYCVTDVPTVFRIYNRNLTAQYVFCPILLSTGQIDRDNCVLYQSSIFDYEDAYNKLHILLYFAIGAVCLVFGALCVYAIIRKHPNLLKGSKRIVFVKHKSVDALVLPPKVPLRNDWVNPESTPHFNHKKIFTMPSNHIPNRFKRSISRRSSNSGTPSYISALQPTEDQLVEWRIRHHFNNDVSLTSNPSELSTYSWVSSDDGLYHSIDVDNYRIYETLK